MPVTYTTGDALGPTAPLAVAHGCNLIGVMGRGFALAIHNRWPSCYEEYRRVCQKRCARLGDVHVWTCPVTPGRVVFNCFTQPRPGPCADPAAVATCLIRVVNIAHDRKIDAVTMPWIGCGLGGLQRAEVRGILERLNTDGVELHVFEPEVLR